MSQSSAAAQANSDRPAHPINPQPVAAIDAPASLREVQYECSRGFLSALAELNATLLVTTYQAGKLVTIGSHDGELKLAFHNFDRPMGTAVGQDALAIGMKEQIWLLKSAPDIAPQIDPPGTYQDCYLARSSHFSGDIQCHEMAFCGGELWIVNTLFSCLCTLGPRYSFVPRWQPPFITGLAAEDRCHLNGLAIENREPRYVTALGETDAPRGWREGKASGGCLIEIDSGNIVARGFCMPHSPRVYGDQVFLLNSGTGALVALDRKSGKFDVVARLPGYLRGLSIHNNVALVGLSKIRETSTFGGVPLAERRDELKCGVAVIDLASGQLRGTFEFHSGVTEIFDVSLMIDSPRTVIRGPNAADDGHQPIWVVPPPAV